MYIAINRFKVKKESATDFEKVWKNRQSYLSEVPGFMRFWLLKSEQPEFVEFLSHSQWVNEQAFQGWRQSEQMAKAHSQGSSVGPMMLGHPEFRGYEQAMDQVSGHRTDYRSVFIDQKVEKHFVRESEFQKNLAIKNKEKNLPPINIGPFEGQLLMLLVSSLNAKVGVEVGTLGGYSASWLLRGMPAASKLYTLELEKDRADWVSEVYKNESRLEVLQGPAIENLNSKLKDLAEVDFVFIDADKAAYPDYVRWAKTRVRKGGAIILDNSYVWGGMNYWKETWEQPPNDSWDSFPKGAFKGMSESWELLSEDMAFESSVIPTGEGLLLSIKK